MIYQIDNMKNGLKMRINDLKYIRCAKGHQESNDPLTQPTERIAVMKRIEWVIKELKKHNVKTVLDVGCGVGFTTNLIAQAGYSVKGIDYNKELIHIAKKRYPYLKFEVADASLYNKGKYDAIVVLEVIEHLKYYKRAIKNWLNKNGIILLSTPNSKYSKKENPFHYHEFSYDEIKQIFPNSKIHGAAWHYVSTKPITVLFGAINAIKFRYFFDFLAFRFPKISNSFFCKSRKKR
jgi:2-polyprenyl-3-methyl-5-hydroxy-6-metoxy-1,4-benzoquinol methylase